MPFCIIGREGRTKFIRRGANLLANDASCRAPGFVRALRMGFHLFFFVSFFYLVHFCTFVLDLTVSRFLNCYVYFVNDITIMIISMFEFTFFS